ncbi:MAG TPA: DUF2231 domain-containing protein [Acidimicrobiales bacterium]
MSMSGLTQPLPDQPPGQGPEPTDVFDADAGKQSPLLDLTLRLEHESRLDPVVDQIEGAVEPILGKPTTKALLGGRWLGHAVHPLLTDLPIGFWTSATVLDLVGGQRSAAAAQRLVGLGVLSAVPTAVTGWSDWLSLDRPLRRVGVVHAASNGAALGLYSLSWLARRKGHHASGIVLGLLGGAVASGAGHLGGHMTVGRGAGVLATRDALRAADDD